MLLLSLLCLWLTDIPTSTLAGASPSPLAYLSPWPPEIGKSYPDLELLGADGKKVKLSEFKGSVLLIEPVGMNCPACQAFAGGQEKGGYEGVTPQAGLPPLEELLKTYAEGMTPEDERIQFIQILFYDPKMGVPTPEDAARWAKHFGLEGKKNHHVLVGSKDLQGPIAYNLIPGFQLIDKNFVLRADSTGHNPHDNLYQTLFPMLAKVMKE